MAFENKSWPDFLKGFNDNLSSWMDKYKNQNTGNPNMNFPVDPKVGNFQPQAPSMDTTMPSSIAPLNPNNAQPFSVDPSLIRSPAAPTAEPSMMDRLAKNLQNPATQGLLAMGLNMMATPPRAEGKYSIGEVLGRGGQAGLGAFNEAQNRINSEDLAKMKMNYEMNKPRAIGAGGEIDPATGKITPPQARVGGAESSPFAKINPSQYTPESLAAYKTSNNVSDLRPVDKPEKETSSDVKRTLVDIYGKDGFDKMTPQQKEKNYEKFKHEVKTSVTINNKPSSSGQILNIPPGKPGERNEAALQGLSSADQEIVKKLVNYEYPYPSGFVLKTPEWRNIVGAAAAYDPSFDVKEYSVKQKIRNDFTSGKSAFNIRSLNIAVAHLDTLADKAKKLDNAPVQLWNTIANKGFTATGDSRVTEFNTAATAVESELAAVFKGMGATDQEIKQWRENLSSSQSPKQLKGSIDTAIKLIGGRLGALQSQYETGLGKTKDFHFLSVKSQQILKKLGANINEIDPASAAQSNDNITNIGRFKVEVQ